MIEASPHDPILVRLGNNRTARHIDFGKFYRFTLAVTAADI